jgi:hypothetical protein
MKQYVFTEVRAEFLNIIRCFALPAKRSEIKPEVQMHYIFVSPLISTFAQSISLAKFRFQRYINAWFKITKLRPPNESLCIQEAIPRLETKNNCAGEGQQQFNRPTLGETPTPLLGYR